MRFGWANTASLVNGKSFAVTQSPDFFKKKEKLFKPVQLIGTGFFFLCSVNK
jgi:hypothetical protein